MAIACFGFVTFFPLLPLFSLPRLNSCISRSTLFCAFGPYLRPRLDDFLLDDFLPDDELERCDLLDEPLEERDRDELRCERLEDDLLPPLLCDREDELDLLRDELFLRAVAIGTSLLRY